MSSLDRRSGTSGSGSGGGLGGGNSASVGGNPVGVGNAASALNGRSTTRRGGTTGAGNGLSSSTSANSSSRAAAAASFHPRLITNQIIALQCFHYFLLAFLFQVNSVFFKTTVTIDRIFTDRYVQLWTPSGWPDVGASLIASLAGSVLLAIIVEKSKKCLDFGVTIFLIHLFACIIYNGLPTVLDWWVVHILGMILMILLGEYLCSRRELDDIPLLLT